MRKIYFHIGYPKCASSTVQRKFGLHSPTFFSPAKLSNINECNEDIKYQLNLNEEAQRHVLVFHDLVTFNNLFHRVLLILTTLLQIATPIQLALLHKSV